MRRVKIADEIATFKNGKVIMLPCAQYDHSIEFVDRILFVLGRLEDNHRNVWCFDLDGNKLWEIEPSIWERPYYLIEQDPKRGLIACDQNGDIYRLDAETGYIEWIGGDKGEAVPGGKNKILHERREKWKKLT